ncbi:hypothetical protein [Adlercreutzia sp. ZJ304]|uniref:hypothetical protein n=1 Tax=Adlercreutzia sp. ZJ304 TaxID=2709791 RepID=UPI0013EBED21|nr:hypothetical protein [Adlercreutzia sp. ZJ304]
MPFFQIVVDIIQAANARYQYEYTDIMRMLHDNSKLTNVSETISTFWRMYIIDALVGNIAGISEIRRDFYIKMIDLRYKIILHDAYIAFRGEAL